MFLLKWWRLVGHIYRNQLVCRELFLFLPHNFLWILTQLLLIIFFGTSLNDYYFLFILLIFFCILFCIIKACLDYYDAKDQETDPLERAQQDLGFSLGAISLSVYASCYVLLFNGPISVAFFYLFFQTNTFTILLYFFFIKPQMKPIDRTQFNYLHRKTIYLHYIIILFIYISIIYSNYYNYQDTATKICGHVMSFGLLAYFLMAYPPMIADFVLVVMGGLRKQWEYV